MARMGLTWNHDIMGRRLSDALSLTLRNLANFQTLSEKSNGRCPRDVYICASPFADMAHTNVYVSNIGIGGGVPLHIGVDLALLVQLYWAMRRPRFVGRVMRMVPTPFLFLSTTKTKNIPTASQGDSLQKRCN